MSEYNRVVKYAQEYKIEALSKQEDTSQDRVHVEDMDTEQLEQHTELGNLTTFHPNPRPKQVVH